MIKRTYHDIKGMKFTEQGKHAKYTLIEKYGVKTGIRIKKPVKCGKVSLMTTGMLWLDKGYGWNGATGMPDRNGSIRPSAVHDAIFQLIMAGHLKADKWRKVANRLFKKMCIEDGLSWIWRKYSWIGLKLVSGLHIKAHMRLHEHIEAEEDYNSEENKAMCYDV